MKKRKGLWKRTLMKRIGSLVLILAMVLTMIPFSSSERAVKAADTKTIYLNAKDVWDKDDAWFSAYAWGGTSTAQWYKMKDLDFDGIYEADIPSDSESIIFLRQNPATSEEDFNNNWGKTGDLIIEGTCYTITGWEAQDGTWSDDEPVESTPVFTVAGVSGLCGSDWNQKDTSNDMTLNKDGKYEKVYENVKASETAYKYKVVLGHDWIKSWYDKTNCEENNSTVKVDVDDSTVTITFDPETRTVSSEVVKPGETPGGGDSGDTDTNTYEATFHFSNNQAWNTVNLYAWTKEGDTETKLTGAWPGSMLSLGDDGLYTATVSFEATSDKKLYYIFNNGTVQTTDLSLSLGDFKNNKADIWVELGGLAEGKYTATPFLSAGNVGTAPVVNRKSVTFCYKNAGAKSVSVKGSFDDWKSEKVMTNKDGIWSCTIDNLDARSYEYKFCVDGSEQLIPDPCNNQIKKDTVGNTNSVFYILSSEAVDSNKITIEVNYQRADNQYTVQNADGNETGTWNAYVWGDSMAGTRKDFKENGDMEIIVEPAREAQYVKLKTRLSTDNKEWLKEEGEVTINLADIVSGTINVYITSSGTNGDKGEISYYQVLDTNSIVKKNKVTDVQYDYDNNTISVNTLKPLTNPETELGIVNATGNSDTIAVTNVKKVGMDYVLTLDKDLDLVNLYQYKITYDAHNYTIGIDSVYASEKFDNEFTYTGSDLGATYSKESTTFKVWAPTAENVKVHLYATGSDDAANTPADKGTTQMTKGEKGVWSATIEGNLNGVYYTYDVTVNGETVSAVDPYARTTGVNGKRGMVIDLDATDPGQSAAVDTNVTEKWSEIKNKPASYTDAIIYELHVRDFSIDESSGMENKGKFLALTETGTTVTEDSNADGVKAKTGLDYLTGLGITHLHLLPIYDYGSVDETKLDEPQFNWGYDPVNYNTPEGSYSTNPYDGTARVAEMKEMVDTLHENEIGVIMDVVYNHVYNADEFCFNQIVPGYFSRVDSNTSGCGNDTASERDMVRKYIVDSVNYWADEYHIDGFRFDLVGLLDVDTIKQIVTTVHEDHPNVIFYGEGWDMDSTNKEPGTEMAKQGNASKTPGFAYFSDGMRNTLAGDNGKTTGFVSGATGKESDLASNFMANPWWTSNPSQVVQYASCHDNYSLIDKLLVSTHTSAVNADIIKMNNLAAAIYMTSQGIPFIHAGEEMLREKVDDDKRCENSYNASDAVNSIKWDNLEKEEYAANSEYYKGLIAFRKAHPALSLATADEVKNTVYKQEASDKLVSFWIDGSKVEDEDYDSIYVIFNADNSAKTVTLPAGDWDICINGTKAGTEAINEKPVTGSVSVEGISAMVLVQEKSTEHPVASHEVILGGQFNAWANDGTKDWSEVGLMQATSDPDVVTKTLSIPEGTYEFVLRVDGNSWYGNSGTIEDATGEDGWVMATDGGNCKLKASGGAYTFTYRISTNTLKVTCDANGGTVDGEDEYYLCGYINGANYAMGMATGQYKFGENGKLTVKFDKDSYVVVKNGASTASYWTNGYLGNVSSATLYKTTGLTQPASGDKLLIPGGVEVELTLEFSEDKSTVHLSYKQTASVGYEDKSGVQNGVTLHCWNWSFEEIEKNMPLIAAQGFTAVQTSPIQPLKEATNLSTNSVGTHWWVYYQPTDFVITTQDDNALGTKAELISMIETAHEYGIKVIVDVVANHMANDGENTIANAVKEDIRTNPGYWHNILKNTEDWNDREQVTQYCMSGLPDLNTGNEDVQTMVFAFLKECIDAGVDGFRFDAAKSIETPSDDEAYASDFWPNMVNGIRKYAKDEAGKEIYVYGEILDNPAISISAYTEYMAVTDNEWGNHLRQNIASDNAAAVAGYYKATDASNLVLWAESHDTYATDNAYESSYNVKNEDIIKTWAIVASRSDAMALYLARPEKMEQALGVAYVDETGWASPEVQAINNFRNQMLDSDETEVGNNNGFSYVRYGNSIVLVKAQEQTSGFAPVGENKINVEVAGMEAGTYTDQISGNTFTVTSGFIEGSMGDFDIAILYTPTNTVEVQETTGGKVSVGNTIPKTGSVVTITVTPDNGKEVDTITVNDKNGNIVAVTKKDANVYTYTQPEGKVTINVTFKEASATPGTDTPGTDTPGTDTPGTDTPGTDTPGTDTPGTDTPGTDTPGTDTPGTDTPGTDTPGTDTPGTDNGDVTKKPGKTEDGKYAASLGGSVDELKNVIFTEEELAEIAAGKDASVYLTIADISKKVTDAEKTLIKNEAEGYSVGIYLDLNLFKVIGDSNPQQMKELGKGITVSIMIPDSLLNTDSSIKRTYAIVRIHEGKATLLEGTFNESTKEFSFKTDKFSTYAIVYKDEAASAQKPNTQPPNGGTTLGADTGDSNGIFLYGLLAVAAMTAMAGVGMGKAAKRRRRG